jgi:hypothetical protein
LSGRACIILGNGFNGTNRLAINAFLEVDIELMNLLKGLCYILCRMDAIDRTHINEAVSFTSMHGSAIV